MVSMEGLEWGLLCFNGMFQTWMYNLHILAAALDSMGWAGGNCHHEDKAMSQNHYMELADLQL